MVSNNPNPFNFAKNLFSQNGPFQNGPLNALQNALSKPGGGIEAMFNGTAETIGQVMTSTPLINTVVRQMTQNELPPFIRQLQDFQITRQMLTELIKEALNLPKEPEQALRRLAKEPLSQSRAESEVEALTQSLTQSPETPVVKKQEQQALKELFTQEVDLGQLQSLVKEGSQKAQQQVMKMMQSGDPTLARYGGELGKMASLFGKLAADSGPSSKPTAKNVENFILLYLPFYPLVNPQQLQVDLEGGGAAEDAETEHSITIYLKTATLGRFRVEIREGQALQLGITVWHEAIAESFMPYLAKQLKAYCQQHGLPTLKFEAGKVEGDQADKLLNSAALADQDTTTETSHSTPSDNPVGTGDIPGQSFKGATQKEDHKKIHLQRGQSVTVLALNTAYYIAKEVFEADEQGRLLQKKRKNLASKPSAPQPNSPRRVNIPKTK